MKILYLTNSFPSKESSYDGIFNYRRVEQLIRKGVYVEVVSYNNIIQKKKLSMKRNYNLQSIGFTPALNVNVINYINIPPFKNSLLSSIRKIYFKKKFDLIHSHFVWNGHLCHKLKKLFDIPYVLTVHGSDIHTEPFRNSESKTNALEAIESAEKTIFVSNYLLEKAKEFGYNKKNYEVIPNGINTEEFKLIPECGNKFRLRTKGEKIIGFVGGLDPVKRAGRLPELFHAVLKKTENVRFLIVGDGVLRKDIESELDKYMIKDKVIMTGNVHPDDIPYYMNNVDVLVLPSEKEGFPCVVMEAFSCGVPVVGSNNGGIPEAIGDCGMLIEDGEGFISRFADAAVKVLMEYVDKNKLVKRAVEFSWDKIVDREIGVYDEIISKEY